MIYVVECDGDIRDDKNFHLNYFESLEQALSFISKFADQLDLEDDKCWVWEVNVPANAQNVVWHFTGWHWNPPEIESNRKMEPGKLPGHEQSLEEELSGND